MGSPKKKSAKRGRKVRVELRRNRLKPGRVRDWTQRTLDADEHEVEAVESENIKAKGELSRRRTVTVPEQQNVCAAGLARGTVIALRGLYAEVDDGQEIWPCTLRRMMLTRLIKERHPVTVGDRVHFRKSTQREGVVHEGVIEQVESRRGQLRRRSGKRMQTIVANVDKVVIVSSAAFPEPKPQLIDRYIVAALVGKITPVICMNKIDLDPEEHTDALLDLHARLGYQTLRTSARTGQGIDALREVLRGCACVLAGQSGVGKSSLLNAVQPGLKLKIGDIIQQTEKGRHTTVTARLLRLEVGGYVVDTPGVRSFDLSDLDRAELEAYFAEFLPHIPNCKFPNCTHTHEQDCAVKAALERAEISPERYRSYLHMFEEHSS